MKHALAAFLLIGMIALAAFAEGQPAPGLSRPSLPDADFEFQPSLGTFFQMDPTGLFNLTLSPGILFMHRFIGDTFTYLLVMASVAPYASLIWPHRADGTRVDASSADFTNALYKQGMYGLSATLYQGIWYDGDRPELGNIINIFLGYSAFYSDNYETVKPDAFIHAGARPDKDTWFGTILKTGIAFKDVSVNRLFNTRRGTEGQVGFDWAPLELGNDILGRTDFSRISAYVSTSFPLLENKSVSLSLHQKTSFEIKWGNDIPVAAHYGAAAASGMAAVRQTLIPDGLMQGICSVNSRIFFPTAFESGMMPGFTIFCDFGLYDDYDYRFSFSRFLCTAGGAFVVHLDSSSIIPMSMLMDMNIGARYDFGDKKPFFYFEMSLLQ